MRKLLSTLILAAILGMVLVPAVSMAQPDTLKDTCDATIAGSKGVPDCLNLSVCSTKPGDTSPAYNENCGICCMLSTIYRVTDWVFYILTLIVVLMVIYGGFVILTASGSPEKAGKGKGILTYAIIGLAVALLAKIIPSLVKFIMGV